MKNAGDFYFYVFFSFGIILSIILISKGIFPVNEVTLPVKVGKINVELGVNNRQLDVIQLNFDSLAWGVIRVESLIETSAPSSGGSPNCRPSPCLRAISSAAAARWRQRLSLGLRTFPIPYCLRCMEHPRSKSLFYVDRMIDSDFGISVFFLDSVPRFFPICLVPSQSGPGGSVLKKTGL